MEDKYLGYLLGALDDDERREVDAALAEHPESNSRLELLRQALEPLAADRDAIDPPPDLAVRTIACVAAHLVETEGSVVQPGPASPVAEFLRTLGRRDSTPVYPWHGGEVSPTHYRRRDVASVLGLAAALLLVALAGVMTLRQTREVQACQNNMRLVHQGLDVYASTHDGRYPQVSPNEEVHTTLASFKNAGTMPQNLAFTCPGATHPNNGLPNIDYAYHLGYRDEQGQLQGLSHRPDDDLFPIMADAPERLDKRTTPINHRKGQNVLFAGGNVRFCTNPFVGPEVGGRGDDIYYNTAYEVKAGTNRSDIVLGCANESPEGR